MIVAGISRVIWATFQSADSPFCQEARIVHRGNRRGGRSVPLCVLRTVQSETLRLPDYAASQNRARLQSSDRRDLTLFRRAMQKRSSLDFQQSEPYRMNRLLTISLSAFTLAACSTPNNDISTFYRPNIAVPAGTKTTIAASFILTSPGTVRSTAQSYVNSGYRLLGESDFANLTAAPLRAEALSYAQQIGANLVIYSVEPIGQEVHPITKTVMDQPSRYITTNSTTKVQGNSNDGGGGSTDLPAGMNSEMREFEKANGINSSGGDTTTKTTTTTTFIPAKYHSEVVPQTFTRTQHAIAFLAK